MPYVTVIKDFANVQPKIILGLTKRQVASLAVAGVIAIPGYFLLRPIIGVQAITALIFISFPILFVGFYPLKDGKPIEKVMANYIKVRYVLPAKRPYKTDTIYSRLELFTKIQEMIELDTAERENKKNKKAGSIRRSAKKHKKKNRKAY